MRDFFEIDEIEASQGKVSIKGISSPVTFRRSAGNRNKNMGKSPT